MATNDTTDAKIAADGTAGASQGTSDAKSPSLENLVPAVSDAPKGQVTLGQNAGAFGPWGAHKLVDAIADEIAAATAELLVLRAEMAEPVRSGDAPEAAGSDAVAAEEAAQDAPILVPDGDAPDTTGSDAVAEPVRSGDAPDTAGPDAVAAEALEHGGVVPAPAGAPTAGALVGDKQASDERVLKVVTLAARVLVVSDRSLLPGDWAASWVRSSLRRLERRLEPLVGRLHEEKEPLKSAIAQMRAEETSLPPSQRQNLIGGNTRGLPNPAVSGAGTTPAASVPSVLSGAFGDAINLLSFLRTDYTITATGVTAAPAELSTLTAARLAGTRELENKSRVRVTVEADAFSTLSPASSLSPTSSVALLKTVLDQRDDTVTYVSELQALLAPVQAELTAISARATTLEQAWATAAVAGKGDTLSVTQLQAVLDDLAAQAARRQKAIADAAAEVTYAQQVVTDTDTALAALLQTSGPGEAPLLTAVRYERLDHAVGDRKITHVLYVNLDAAAADAVTRQSLLGTSGRISFLSSGNASWMLLDTATGAIVGGGQKSLAEAMTFSLETREIKIKRVEESEQAGLGDDRLDGLEWWAKALVVILSIAFAALGVLSFIAIFRIAFDN
jgi:hypothetical protein